MGGANRVRLGPVTRLYRGPQKHLSGKEAVVIAACRPGRLLGVILADKTNAGARVVSHDISVGVGPGGGLEIDRGRFRHPHGVALQPQQSRAAGPAQLPAVRGQTM
jgi:hypothetical protein